MSYMANMGDRMTQGWAASGAYATRAENGLGASAQELNEAYGYDRNGEYTDALSIEGEVAGVEPLDFAVQRTGSRAEVYRLGLVDASDESDQRLLEAAKNAQAQFERRPNLNPQQDTMLSDAVQTWVVNELGARERKRGIAYAPGSQENEYETLVVLTQLIDELHEDESAHNSIDGIQEARKLFNIVNSWRQEIEAGLPVARPESISSQAA